MLINLDTNLYLIDMNIRNIKEKKKKEEINKKALINSYLSLVGSVEDISRLENKKKMNLYEHS